MVVLADGHLKVGAYAIACGFFGLIFYYIGVSMGWLYVRIWHPLETHNQSS